MRYRHFTAGSRGFFNSIFRAPRVRVLIVAGLGLLSIGTTASLSLASAQPANASGTCQPNGGYSFPSAVQLSQAPIGVTIQDDGVRNYGVGGDSIDAVRSALDTCAPSFMGADKSGEFLAYTSYTINWSYDTEITTTGACRLTNIKIGLHLSQLEPALTSSSSTVQSKWATFSSGLQNHENGHKAIDVAQADMLLTSLNSIKGSCTQITSFVKAATNGALQNLITANADHDSDTDYGRDQGATW